MATKKEIGEAIPKGVIDASKGSVGVEEPRPTSLEKQVQQLRSEIEELRQRMAESGYSFGNAEDAEKDKGRATSDPLLVTLAIGAAALAGMAFARLALPSSRSPSPVEDLVTELGERMSRLLERSDNRRLANPGHWLKEVSVPGSRRLQNAMASPRTFFH